MMLYNVKSIIKNIYEHVVFFINNTINLRRPWVFYREIIDSAPNGNMVAVLAVLLHINNLIFLCQYISHYKKLRWIIKNLTLIAGPTFFLNHHLVALNKGVNIITFNRSTKIRKIVKILRIFNKFT